MTVSDLDALIDLHCESVELGITAGSCQTDHDFDAAQKAEGEYENAYDAIVHPETEDAS